MGTTLDRAQLQEHLDRAQQSWLLHDDDDWRAFVDRKSSPRPPWWTPMERGAWTGAHALAIGHGRREEPRALTLLPLWCGNNEDEVDGGDWQLSRVLVDEQGAVVIDLHDDERDEKRNDQALAFFARVRGRRVTVKVVSRGRSYAPGVPGVTHHGAFAVVEAMGRFIVDEVTDVRPLATLPMPTTTVPAFSTILRPGCALDDVDADARELFERAIAKGSFTPDE